MNSFPAAKVFVDGRSVGYSPFRIGEKVRLGVGEHVLALENHSFEPFSSTIEAMAGKTTEVRYWFDTKSLQVSERR